MTRTLAPDETLDGYDRWARGYDALDNPMVAATAWAMDRVPLGAAGLDVIELGCGTGRNVARVLAEGARSYTGVDGSAGMLARAIEGCTDPRCSFVRADLDALAVPAAGFDLALIVLVLEHVADLAPVIAGAARALPPGGRLRVVEIHGDLVATGTNAHFEDDAGAVRFTSFAHSVAALRAAVAGAAAVEVREYAADGALLDAVPALSKHRGRNVVVDLEARW